MEYRLTFPKPWDVATTRYVPWKQCPGSHGDVAMCFFMEGGAYHGDLIWMF